MPAEIATKRAVYRIPGMESAVVRRVEYRDGLSMDLYYPPGQDVDAALKPAVVIVLGYPDVGVSPPFGCQFREMGMTVSWAQLLAASGMIGVVYETGNPASDAHAVLACLREKGAKLGIDGTRIGIWSSSGNVPVALSVLMEGQARCDVLCYGFMLDLDGATGVAQAAAAFHFANPVAGRRVADLPPDTPLCIVRAGREQFAGLNESIDAFVNEALRSNRTVTLMNHATGAHAFDLMEDSQASRDAIRAILAFLQIRLGI